MKQFISTDVEYNNAFMIRVSLHEDYDKFYKWLNSQKDYIINDETEYSNFPWHYIEIEESGYEFIRERFKDNLIEE